MEPLILSIRRPHTLTLGLALHARRESFVLLRTHSSVSQKDSKGSLPHIMLKGTVCVMIAFHPDPLESTMLRSRAGLFWSFKSGGSAGDWPGRRRLAEWIVCRAQERLHENF